MGVIEGSDSIEIDGTVEQAFAAITDFESYPEWQGEFKEAKILERDDQGRGDLVEYLIETPVKTIRYTLRYSYKGAPGTFSWELDGGDVKEVKGAYTFEPHDGGIKATIELAVDPGFWMPGPVRKRIHRNSMATAVKDLKARVEQG